MGANTRAGRGGFAPSYRLVVHPTELVEVAAVLVGQATSLLRPVKRPTHPVELALMLSRDATGLRCLREHTIRLRDCGENVSRSRHGRVLMRVDRTKQDRL